MNQNEDKTVNATGYNNRLMNNVVRMPMIVGPCQDSYITDLEPNEPRALLDYWGDEGVCSLGYNTPEVFQAAAAFFGSGDPHQLPDIYPHCVRWDAADLLCHRTGMDRVYFANSGTEANESAIKLARKYWWDKMYQRGDAPNTAARHVILTVKGNFHGRTANSLAAGDPRVSPYHREGFGPLPLGFGVLDWDTDFGRVEFKQTVTDGIEHPAKEPDWSRVAAIILAPVLGNNLVQTYKPSFWQELKRIRDEQGILLIFDDIQAGSGRAGYYATWQHPDIQVKPNIMTLGKGMAMGYPMSCVLASERVAEAFTPGVHFNTFGGSPFVCYMAMKMIQWLDTYLGEVREKGKMIRATFKEMPWIKECDGSGMLNAFTPDFEKYGYDGFMFIHQAREAGLCLATHRRYGPIRFTPRLNVPKRELFDALRMLESTHQALAPHEVA